MRKKAGFQCYTNAAFWGKTPCIFSVSGLRNLSEELAKSVIMRAHSSDIGLLLEVEKILSRKKWEFSDKSDGFLEEKIKRTFLKIYGPHM